MSKKIGTKIEDTQDVNYLFINDYNKKHSKQDYISYKDLFFNDREAFFGQRGELAKKFPIKKFGNHSKDDETREYYEEGMLVKELPNLSDNQVADLIKEIDKVMSLTIKLSMGGVYLPIPRGIGLYSKNFVTILENNRDFFDKYFDTLLERGSMPVYAGSQFLRVGSSGNALHNDLDQHLVDKERLMAIHKGEFKGLQFHLALTESNNSTKNDMCLYPGTNKEVTTAIFAFKYLVDNNYIKEENIENELKLLYLSERTGSIDGQFFRLHFLQKYYKLIYKDVDCVWPEEVLVKEGVFWDPQTLHYTKRTANSFVVKILELFDNKGLFLYDMVKDYIGLTTDYRYSAIFTFYTEPRFSDENKVNCLLKSTAILFNIEYEEVINIFGFKDKLPKYFEVEYMKGEGPYRNESLFTLESLSKWHQNPKVQEYLQQDFYHVDDNNLKIIKELCRIPNEEPNSQEGDLISLGGVHNEL